MTHIIGILWTLKTWLTFDLKCWPCSAWPLPLTLFSLQTLPHLLQNLCTTVAYSLMSDFLLKALKLRHAIKVTQHSAQNNWRYLGNSCTFCKREKSLWTLTGIASLRVFFFLYVINSTWPPSGEAKLLNRGHSCLSPELHRISAS